MENQNHEERISTEWISYFLLQSSHDELLDFARSLGYNGENDYELVEWVTNEVKDYVNTQRVKKYLKLNDRYFFSSLKRQVEHDRDYYKRIYDEQINNGYFIKLTEGETDKLSKNIKKRVLESYKDTLNSSFNKRKQGLYLTKDKNLYIEKYDILKEKIQGLEEAQTNITNGFKEDLNIESKQDQNQNFIQIDVELNDTLLNLKIKGLIDVIENHILNNSIIDKYVYSFFIGDTWKSYPLKSTEDWNKLLNMLKNGPLIFNLDTLEDLYWSDGFYNKADQVLPDLSIIKAIKLKKVKDVHERGDNSGSFFQYLIKDKYKQLEHVLSKAQIFNTINETGEAKRSKSNKVGNKHRKELNYNCFCYALKIASKDECNLRIGRNEWKLTFNEICKDCIGRRVSIKDIKDIVSKYNLYINLTTFSFKDQKRNRKDNKFGDKDKAILTCNLGIFKQRSNMNHFFYNCQVPVTRYFIKNIDSILEYSQKHNKPIEWSCSVTKFSKNCYQTDKIHFKPIEMIDMIYGLFEANVFEPLTYNDTANLNSDLHHYNKEDKLLILDPKIKSFLGGDEEVNKLAEKYHRKPDDATFVKGITFWIQKYIKEVKAKQVPSMPEFIDYMILQSHGLIQ